MSLSSILDFVEPINLSFLSKDEGYRDTQLGKHIKSYEDQLPDITDADINRLNSNRVGGDENQEDTSRLALPNPV